MNCTNMLSKSQCTQTQDDLDRLPVTTSDSDTRVQNNSSWHLTSGATRKYSFYHGVRPFNNKSSFGASTLVTIHEDSQRSTLTVYVYVHSKSERCDQRVDEILECT